MRWNAAAPLEMSPAVWGMNPDGGGTTGSCCIPTGRCLLLGLGVGVGGIFFWALDTSAPVMPGIKALVFAMSTVLTNLIFLVLLPLRAVFQRM